jgi:hypothetical protein
MGEFRRRDEWEVDSLRTKGITERESHIEQVQVKGILNAHI